VTPLTAPFTWRVRGLHLETAKGSVLKRVGIPSEPLSVLTDGTAFRNPTSLLRSPFSNLRSTLPAQLGSPYPRDNPLFVLGNSTSLLAFPAGARKFTELRSPLQCPFSPLTFTTFTKQHNYRLPGSTRLSHSSSQYNRFTGHLEGKEGLLNAK